MAIKSVGQTNSAFFVEEQVDPASYGGKFLSYDADTNAYKYVGYEEYIQQSAATEQPKTIKEIFDRASGVSRGTPGTFSPVERPNIVGSIHRAATGFTAFNTVADVLAGPKDFLSLGMAAYEGVTGYQTGIDRAETFERASAATATVADKLAASQLEPSWTDYAKGAFGVGLGVFTGNFLGASTAGLGLASTISAEVEADRALTEAGQLERLGYASGLSPTQVSSFTGYQQSIADFMANQEANLTAAQVDAEPTTLAPGTARETVAAVLSSATSTTSAGSRSDSSSSLSFAGLGGAAADAREAAAQREAFAEATRGTSDRAFSFGERDSGDFDRDSGYGGFSGGSGAGGFEGDIGGDSFGDFA